MIGLALSLAAAIGFVLGSLGATWFLGQLLQRRP